VAVDELGIVLLLRLGRLVLMLVLLLLLLVMGIWLNKLMIAMMGELRKRVLERGSLVMEPLDICDILGGELLLLVEGWVGHAGWAGLASCQQAAGREALRMGGEDGGGGGDRKDDEGNGSGTEGRARRARK